MAIPKKKSVNDISLSGVKALVYSESGIGKTVICSTMPGRICLISCESGTLSLRGCPAPIDIYEIHTLEDLLDMYNYLISDGYNEYDSICLDSISEIAEVVLDDARTAKDDKGKLIYPDGRQAYFAMQSAMERLIKQFRNIPSKHILFTAKMERAKDDVSGMILFYPMLPGQKLNQLISYEFDCVFRLCIGVDDKGNTFRYLQTQPDRNSTAKDRSGMLAPMEAPDMTQIINKIIGGTNGQVDNA